MSIQPTNQPVSLPLACQVLSRSVHAFTRKPGRGHKKHTGIHTAIIVPTHSVPR